MKYSVVVLFLNFIVYSLAWAEDKLDLSPPGIANETASTISCIGSPLLIFGLLSIPVVFTVFYFAHYLNVEKKSRHEGKGSFFTDEMLILVLSSFIIASVIHIMYLFWEAHGIPVKYLFSKYFFCNTNEKELFENKCSLFLHEKIKVLPQTCENVYVSKQRGFAEAFILVLSIGTFIYKLILIFIPLISAVALGLRNSFGAIRDIRERRYSSKLVALIYFVDGIVISLTVVMYYSIIYEILLVRWTSLLDWLYDSAVGVFDEAMD